MLLLQRSLRGRRLKGKRTGASGMGVLRARETRVVSRPNSLPLPFRTPATQASSNAVLGASFTWLMVRTSVIRLRWVEDGNARD